MTRSPEPSPMQFERKQRIKWQLITMNRQSEARVGQQRRRQRRRIHSKRHKIPIQLHAWLRRMRRRPILGVVFIIQCAVRVHVCERPTATALLRECATAHAHYHFGAVCINSPDGEPHEPRLASRPNAPFGLSASCTRGRSSLNKSLFKHTYYPAAIRIIQ